MLRLVAITSITAIAVAFSPISAPAAKADGDFDKFLAGAALIAVLGGIALNKQKRKSRDATQVHRQVPAYTPPKHSRQTQRQKIRHEHGQRGVHVHHGKKNNHNRILKEVTIRDNHRPKKCLRQKWTQDGWVSFYNKKCLRRHDTTRTVYHYR